MMMMVVMVVVVVMVVLMVMSSTNDAVAVVYLAHFFSYEHLAMGFCIKLCQSGPLHSQTEIKLSLPSLLHKYYCFSIVNLTLAIKKTCNHCMRTATCLKQWVHFQKYCAKVED